MKLKQGTLVVVSHIQEIYISLPSRYIEQVQRAKMGVVDVLSRYQLTHEVNVWKKEWATKESELKEGEASKYIEDRARFELAERFPNFFISSGGTSTSSSSSSGFLVPVPKNVDVWDALSEYVIVPMPSKAFVESRRIKALRYLWVKPDLISSGADHEGVEVDARTQLLRKSGDRLRLQPFTWEGSIPRHAHEVNYIELIFPEPLRLPTEAAGEDILYEIETSEGPFDMNDVVLSASSSSRGGGGGPFTKLTALSEQWKANIKVEWVMTQGSVRVTVAAQELRKLSEMESEEEDIGEKKEMESISGILQDSMIAFRRVRKKEERLLITKENADKIWPLLDFLPPVPKTLTRMPPANTKGVTQKLQRVFDSENVFHATPCRNLAGIAEWGLFPSGWPTAPLQEGVSRGGDQFGPGTYFVDTDPDVYGVTAKDIADDTGIPPSSVECVLQIPRSAFTTTGWNRVRHINDGHGISSARPWSGIYVSEPTSSALIGPVGGGSEPHAHQKTVAEMWNIWTSKRKNINIRRTVLPKINFRLHDGFLAKFTGTTGEEDVATVVTDWVVVLQNGVWLWDGDYDRVVSEKVVFKLQAYRVEDLLATASKKRRDQARDKFRLHLVKILEEKESGEEPSSLFTISLVDSNGRVLAEASSGGADAFLVPISFPISAKTVKKVWRLCDGLDPMNALTFIRAIPDLEGSKYVPYKSWKDALIGENTSTGNVNAVCWE